jgi:uncharacterized protein (TIGR02145 family)
MKRKLWIPLLVILSVFIIVLIRACIRIEPPKVIDPPTVSTNPITSITAETAGGGGNITSAGGAEVFSCGVCWSTDPNPDINLETKSYNGFGTGWFESLITGLKYSTIYHVRAYATNSGGTSYGDDVSFTTLIAYAPEVTTAPAMTIASSAAIAGGKVTGDGGARTIRGVCWSTNPDPVVGLNNKTRDTTGTGEYKSYMSGLAPSTKYYARAYATNQVGTSYGSQIDFTTIAGVADVTGYIYGVVNIGTQTWMMENLRTPEFSDGSLISNVTDQQTWCNLSTPAYCWFNNDWESHGKTFGGLYNWYAVNSGKLCPAGWHVPVNSEWETLITFLGGASEAGGKMKMATSDPYLSPSSTADNSSLFSALFGCLRDSVYGYTDGGCGDGSDGRGYWWTSESSTVSKAWGILLTPESREIFKAEYIKKNGLSIRCIKN